ncbi:MAG: response regulator [Thiomargarita sp.]|nr:response regulator [Thiomargarita sp.]
MSVSINLLIIDDNKNNRQHLSHLIKNDFDNIELYEADSALTALTTMMKQSVDLIIIETQMSHMNAYDTAKIFQSRSQFRHIPMIFMLFYENYAQFRTKAHELGAVDYLLKPIEANQLISKLTLYVRFLTQQKTKVDKPQSTENAGTHVGFF